MHDPHKPSDLVTTGLAILLLGMALLFGIANMTPIIAAHHH
jgi:hypothetical protein